MGMRRGGGVRKRRRKRRKGRSRRKKGRRRGRKRSRGEEGDGGAGGERRRRGRRRSRGEEGDGGRDLQPLTSDHVVVVVPSQAVNHCELAVLL